MNQHWLRMPAEMQARAQWLICSLNPADSDYKAPQSITRTGRKYLASVVSPSQWLTFAEACHAAEYYGYGIGYVLHEGDPFTCVDLDVKDAENAPNEPGKWTTQEQFQRYASIIETFNSFTEKSVSGKGFHIWIKADIGSGFKRDGIEVYSRERFIACTGNVTLPQPIKDNHMLAVNMVSRMRPIATKFELVEIEPVVDDWYVLQVAVSAANSEKFIRLWTGDWKNEFPSQSEADLALMSMFTFYSESNAQVRRLFRDSALGKREKATKNDRYINETLMKIRGRQHRENAANISGILASADAMLALRQKAANEIQKIQGGYTNQDIDNRVLHPLHAPETPTTAAPPAPLAVAIAQAVPQLPAAVQAGATGLPWPPGALGALARYIYNASVRPVKEVSIVAAIGLTAGFVGKAWNIPQSGLNMYITLLAQSGVGKEAMHSGPSMFMNYMCKDNPIFKRFIEFNEFASGPALMKAFPGRGSFVNISGEWGRRLKRMAQADDRDSPLTTLRTMMTNLYQKSGAGSNVGGIAYSSKDDSVAINGAVAFSFMGESTPGTFYESLTPSMMEDGFLSRFLVIAYDGKRPKENLNQQMEPNAQLLEHYRQIAVMAMRLESEGKAIIVGVTDEASRFIRAFNDECDIKIDATDDESVRQMWNRAALKAQRLAAVLAVASNYSLPCVQIEDMQWAVQVIRADIAIMSKRMDEGDVGVSDGAREKKLLTIMRQFMVTPQADPKLEAMRNNMIIPRLYLHHRVQRIVSFSTYRGGSNYALESTLKSMVENGVIMVVDKTSFDSMYGSKSSAYRLLTS